MEPEEEVPAFALSSKDIPEEPIQEDLLFADETINTATMVNGEEQHDDMVTTDPDSQIMVEDLLDESPPDHPVDAIPSLLELNEQQQQDLIAEECDGSSASTDPPNANVTEPAALLLDTFGDNHSPTDDAPTTNYEFEGTNTNNQVESNDLLNLTAGASEEPRVENGLSYSDSFPENDLLSMDTGGSSLVGGVTFQSEEEEGEAARLQAEEEDNFRMKAEEEERVHIEAEQIEAARLQAEEEERAHIEAEQIEAARFQAEEFEAEEKEAAAQAEEEERLRIEAARLQANEEERLRIEAEEEDRLRIEAEEIKVARLQAGEEERLIIEAEEIKAIELQVQEEFLLIEAEEKEADRAQVEEEERIRIEAEQQETVQEQAVEESLQLGAEQQATANLQAEEEKTEEIEGTMKLQSEEEVAMETGEIGGTSSKSEEEEILHSEAATEKEGLCVEGEHQKEVILQKSEEEGRVRIEAEVTETAEAAKLRDEKRDENQESQLIDGEQHVNQFLRKEAEGQEAIQNRKASNEAHVIAELQESLQHQMTIRAEVEVRMRKMAAENDQYKSKFEEYSLMEDKLEEMSAGLTSTIAEKTQLEQEIGKLRDGRDDLESREAVLSNRLNDAKKKEASKSSVAGRLEEENKDLKTQLEIVKSDFKTVTAQKEKVEHSMEKLKKKCVERVKSSEVSLIEERTLNEERKRKMKFFVETKAEELRTARSGNDELRAELKETSGALSSVRGRLEHMTRQYENSSTKNRELVREMNRMKKNSEQLHELGGSLEMELQKSAQETEEHKNKRLTAKHELMTILRKLEVEQTVSGKLRDSVKFTFTPKALSQQQLLDESLQDFESELLKLSRRLGKPLPPTIHSGLRAIEDDNRSDGNSDGEHDDNGKKKVNSRSEWDTARLLSSLENETQRVSKGIMAFSNAVERLHALLDISGEKTCVSTLNEIFGALAAARAEPNLAIASTLPTTAIGNYEDEEDGSFAGAPVKKGRITNSGSNERYGLVNQGD